MRAESFLVREMRPDEADEVRSLILDGLVEHWGTIDPALNRDLDHLDGVGPDRVVLVATRAHRIVGTGTIVRRDHGCAEIVRMSVARDHRRTGLGQLLIEELVATARRWAVGRVVLETTAAWTDVVHFYEQSGFTLTHFADGPFGRDAWFELSLAD
jgi:GNAT superfamily N-acetyltransferase